jgi:hypothetical protein
MTDSVDRVLQALEAKGVAVEADGERLTKKRVRRCPVLAIRRPLARLNRNFDPVPMPYLGAFSSLPKAS